MMKYKAFDGVAGFIYRIEEKYNAENDTVHPHLHVLIAFKDESLCKSFLESNMTGQWHSAWIKAIKDSSFKNIYVSGMNSSLKTLLNNAAADSDFRDYFKNQKGTELDRLCYYLAKPFSLNKADYATFAKVIKEYDREFKRMKLLRFCGCFYKLSSSLKANKKK